MKTRQTISKRRGPLRFQQVLIPLLLVLVGAGVLLYPVVATQYNNVKQRDFANQYNNQVLQTRPDDLAGDLARAREYNSRLSGIPILDPWLLKAARDPGSGAYRDYNSQLHRFEAMGRLRVPSVGIELPIFHGTSDPVLQKGVGHLYGTALPVGGAGSHPVLTSHSALPNATLFDRLPDVKKGELIFVDVGGETLAYRVDQIKVILPTELDDLKPVPERDYLTLMTCTPYAINTHRLLVRGERVAFTPEVAKQNEPAQRALPQMEPWMWWLTGGAGAGLGGIVLLVARERRRDGARRSKTASGEQAPSAHRGNR